VKLLNDGDSDIELESDCTVSSFLVKLLNGDDSDIELESDIGKETSYITNIFRQRDPKIAHPTKNTTGKLLTPQNPTQDPYSLSGAHKLHKDKSNQQLNLQLSE
jgi:hypothetical protein